MYYQGYLLLVDSLLSLCSPQKYLHYVPYVLYCMYVPDVKVYIRAENVDKWNAISNKAEWLNTLLQHADSTKRWGETQDTPVGPVVTVLTETLPKRTIGDILGEIKDTERLRDEELEYCQDESEIRRIGKEAKEVIDALWAEYHTLKGDKI